MKIEINKKQAWKMFMTKTFFKIFSISLFLIIILAVLLNQELFPFQKQYLLLTVLFIIIFPFLFKGFNIIYFYLYLNHLDYEVEEGILTTKYQIIMKHTNSARLQVVNTVNINQSLWEKLFGLYTIEVDYGFGDSGYTHYFRFLLEDQANEISHLIKPRGNIPITIK